MEHGQVLTQRISRRQILISQAVTSLARARSWFDAETQYRFDFVPLQGCSNSRRNGIVFWKPPRRRSIVRAAGQCGRDRSPVSARGAGGGHIPNFHVAPAWAVGGGGLVAAFDAS